MPHEFESGVFTEGQPAWHGLGVTLPSKAIDSREALQYSGLADWNLTKEPVFTRKGTDGYGNEVTGIVQGYKAIVRAQDNSSLGVVGERYRIIQNEEAFDWCDSLLGGEGFHYKTAGSLRNGKIVWMLAQPPFQVELPDSPVELYLLLTNRHDGSACCRVAVTPVRVVCMNTLKAALDESKQVVSIRHTANAEAKLLAAQEVLGLTKGAAERIKERAEALTAFKVSDADFTNFLNKLLPVPDEGLGKKMMSEKQDLVRAIYVNHPTQQDIKGTAWGVWNAVVAYNDHVIESHNTARSTAVENRMIRITTEQNITDRALTLLGVK